MLNTKGLLLFFKKTIVPSPNVKNSILGTRHESTLATNLIKVYTSKTVPNQTQ